MSYESGTVTANVVNSAATQQTVTWIYGSKLNGAGSTTIGTVGAGKKWTIVYMQMSGSSGDNTAIRLVVNGVTAMSLTSNSTADRAPQAVAVCLPYTQGLKLAATQTIVLTNDGSQASTCAVGYIEETA